MGKEIPVVCDTYVDREFGTGVVKITPAHDPNDFEVGVRHGLPVVKVLTDDAHMTQDCGKYAGMDRYDCLLYTSAQRPVLRNALFFTAFTYDGL